MDYESCKKSLTTHKTEHIMTVMRGATGTVMAKMGRPKSDTEHSAEDS